MSSRERWRGLSALLGDAVEHASSAVERIHMSTARRPFQIIESIPPLKAPAQLVHAVHDSLVTHTYKQIRFWNGAVQKLVQVALAEQEGPVSPDVPRYSGPMIDHMSIQVSDYDKSKSFYLRALEPLGYSVVMELSRDNIPQLPSPKVCGLGEQGKPDFWLAGSDQPTTPQHLAFRAVNRGAVDAFYKSALAAGAKPNGEPGLRPQYHPNYYGAFVIDLNGHNLEAVCHDPA